ncbi:MAG: sulfur reduction protein DsrS, partial [Gammaproteobacteria bacterium]|nr:sulfur reduction protein DsrS [Gammaproteobacteria bacterium]
VAAVHAQGLTDELAARAWWAMPTAENARKMLEKRAVVEGDTGKELADFLIEFLPFEEEQSDMIESVRLVLQPGLISQQEKEKLWSKTKTKRSFYVGFLHASADDLPVEVDAHTDHEKIKQLLMPLLEQGNPYALMLEKVLSEKGQAFLNTIEDAMKKPGNQDVVVSLLAAIAKYFDSIAPEKFTEDDIGLICSEAESFCCGDNEMLNEVVSVLSDTAESAQQKLCAMTVMACLSVKLVNPIFARTDAIGTVMRKKIKPVTDPVFEQLKVLRS